MVSLFDIMRQAGGGTSLPTLSRHFGLDGAATQRALDALLPAFSLAFQRNAQNPDAFAHLLGLMTSGRYQPAFDGTGISSGLGGGGDDVLSTLFGSKETVGRIADQAAAATGLGVQVLQRMMPVLAATLVGGMFRYASVEGFADVLRQWSDALRATAPPAPVRPPAAQPWSAWFDMMGPLSASADARTAASGPDASPFETWARLMASLAGAKPAPPPPARPPEPNPFEALSQMFESGREVQAQYLGTLQSILDGAWGMARSR